MGGTILEQDASGGHWLRRLKTRIYNAAVARLPDVLSVQLQFFAAHGAFANLQSPKTFSEKIQVRKLREQDPRFVELADKVLVKPFVAAALGPEWLIPTLWTGDRLPPRDQRVWPKPYVLKANHGAGWNAFVRTDEDDLGDDLERLTQGWLATAYLPHLRERHYHKIKPRLLVEPLIGDPSSLPTEYKFFCFSGRVEFIMAQVDRVSNLKIATLNRFWEKLDLTYGYQQPSGAVKRPHSLDQMMRAAETLARGFAFVRVDFYEVDHKPLFGEMTFTPGSGFERFNPSSYNQVFGQLWTEKQPAPCGSATRHSDRPRRFGDPASPRPDCVSRGEQT